jgi:hypothetical protein
MKYSSFWVRLRKKGILMRSVVPEAELLLLLARQDLDDARLARAVELTRLNSSAMDWAKFADLAIQHRVSRLVGWHSVRLLRSHPGPGVVPPVLELLHDNYLAGIGRSGSIKNELVRVLDACSGLQVAVRKGVHLAFQTYREPALRPIGDFDLLVTRENASKVAATLNDLGYREGELTPDGRLQPFTRAQRLFWQLHGSDLPMLSRPASNPYMRGFKIDISVELTLPGKGPQVPLGEFLDRAVQTSVGGSPCLVLAPEDTVIDLGLHLYKNSTCLRFMERGRHRRLLKYVDIIEFIKHTHDQFSWQTLLGRVRALGIADPIYFSLAHLEVLFPGSVPQEVLAGLAAGLAKPAEFLQTYGQWDLPDPRQWQTPFLRRFFDHSADAELPTSRSLV